MLFNIAICIGLVIILLGSLVSVIIGVKCLVQGPGAYARFNGLFGIALGFYILVAVMGNIDRAIHLGLHHAFT